MLRIAVARARAHAGVLLGLALVAALLAGLGTWTAHALTTADVRGTAAGIGTLSGTDGAMRWTARVGDDPREQRLSSADVLDETVAANGGDWWRAVRANVPWSAAGTGGGAGEDGGGTGADDGRDATAPDGTDDGAGADTGTGAEDPDGDGPVAEELMLLADPRLPARAELTDGSWPAAEGETAVGEAAAGALGLERGDTIDAAGTQLEVVGVWAPRDPADPGWFGASLPLTGVAGGEAGPFAVTEATLRSLDTTAYAEWTAVATAGATSEQARELVVQLDRASSLLREVSPDLRSDGQLAASLGRLAAAVAATRAVLPVPPLLIAVLGGIVVWRLAGVLAAGRRDELLLLRARGASSARIAWHAAVEAAAVCLPAAAVGALGGGLLAPAGSPGAAPGADGDATLPGTDALPLAAVAAPVVVLADAVAASALQASRAGGRADDGGRSGRGGSAVQLSATILLTIAAAVAFVQFTGPGSPVVTAAAGEAADPVATAAPVLMVTALPALVLAALPLVARMLDPLVSRSRGLVPTLAFRQVTRRLTLFASVSFVSMLAVAGVTLAFVVSGTWAAHDRDAARLANGGDVAVQLPGRDAVTDEAPLTLGDPFAALPGVSRVAPVVRTEARIGSDPVTLLAAPAEGTADPALQVTEGDSGPTGTVTGTLRFAADGATAGAIDVWLWAQSPQGAAARIPAGSFPIAAGTGALRIEPPQNAPHVLGLELRLRDAPGASVRVTAPELRVGDSTGRGGAEGPGDVEHVLDARAGSARIPLAAAGEPRLAIDRAVADEILAERGDGISLRTEAGVTIEGTAARIVPAVAGAPERAALIDLGTLERIAFVQGAPIPAADRLWLATEDPHAVAERIAQGPFGGATATTAEDRSASGIAAPAFDALRVGGVAGLALALVALFTLVVALSRARGEEDLVLCTLGVTRRRRARGRMAELAAVAGLAVVLGAAAGWLTAASAAPALARATVPGAPAALAAPLTVDVLPWCAVLAGFVLAAAAAILLAGTHVRRAARMSARPRAGRLPASRGGAS